MAFTTEILFSNETIITDETLRLKMEFSHTVADITAVNYTLSGLSGDSGIVVGDVYSLSTSYSHNTQFTVVSYTAGVQIVLARSLGAEALTSTGTMDRITGSGSVSFDYTAPTINRVASTEGLHVKSWGKCETSYDLEDALLTSSEMAFVVMDEKGVLDTWFFGTDTVSTSATKRAKVTVIYNSLTKTNETVFVGYVSEDSIISDVGTLLINFSADSSTDIINKKMVYDSGQATPELNPFGKTANTWYTFIEYLEDIFQLVDSTITYAGSGLTISHDWKFSGNENGTGAIYNGINLWELLLNSDPIYLTNTIGVNNCGDILKKFAFDFCAFTGIYKGKAFFNKLFYYDSTNLQTVTVLKQTKGYRYSLIDYVRVTTHATGDVVYEAGTFTLLSDRFLDKDLWAGFFAADDALLAPRDSYLQFALDSPHVSLETAVCDSVSVAPAEGDVYEDSANVQWTVVGILSLGAGSYDITLEGSTITDDLPPANDSLTRISGSGDATLYYSADSPFYAAGLVFKVKDTTVSSSKLNHGRMVADFWYKYRGNIIYCRIDKFIFRGVDYDFSKSFNYGGYKYQIIKLTIDYPAYTSVVEAIYLGAV